MYIYSEVLIHKIWLFNSHCSLNSLQSNDLVLTLVREAVSRLHIIACPSSFHFLASLKVIKPIATNLLQHGGVAAVLIDNVTAHYYMDKVARAIPLGNSTSAGSSTGISDRSSSSLTLVKVHAAMTIGLRNLQHELRVPIIVTKHILSSPGTKALFCFFLFLSSVLGQIFEIF